MVLVLILFPTLMSTIILLLIWTPFLLSLLKMGRNKTVLLTEMYS